MAVMLEYLWRHLVRLKVEMYIVAKCALSEAGLESRVLRFS